MFVTPGYAQEAAPAETEAHGAVSEAGTVEHHGSGVFPPFDSTYYPSQLLWLALTFGLFYLFLKRVIMPRLAGIIADRQARIAGDLEQASRAKAEADAAVASYEQELAQARAKANSIGQSARDAAKADAEAERKRIEAELDARLDAAQARVSAIKASAMGEVGTIAVDTAEAIIERLTGNNIDRAAVQAAVSASQG